MPTRNVNLTPELDRAVAARVKSGRYENASEVVRAGLRALDAYEAEQHAKVLALERAIFEGDEGGDFRGDPFDAVRKKHSLPRRKKRG